MESGADAESVNFSASLRAIRLDSSIWHGLGGGLSYLSTILYFKYLSRYWHAVIMVASLMPTVRVSALNFNTA